MSSRKTAAWLGLIAATPMFAFATYDFYNFTTHRGLYRVEYQGTVVKTGRTLKYVADLFDEHDTTDASDDDFNHGHYSATVVTDSGETFEVGLSWRDYKRAHEGSWIGNHDGRTRVLDQKP